MKKSMIEVAYQVLTNNNGSMPFVDLWKDVSQEMGFNQTQFEDNIAQFYTDLSLDGRFLNMSQNTWDLRSRHTYSESVMDTDSIAIDEDDEDEEEVEEDEKKEEEKYSYFNPNVEIKLSDARKIDKTLNVGDTIDTEVTPKDFGRVATSTAKQVVVQKIREAERNSIMAEFGDKQDEMLVGTVALEDPDNYYIDLGRTNGILPKKDIIPGEKIEMGSQIKVYVTKVDNNGKSLLVLLSRVHYGFVKRLFELEIPELSDGTVLLYSVARDAGSRSKVAVYSENPNVDPIGACIGEKGSRIARIINELGGEKIDVVRYDKDPAVFIANSLSPAKNLTVIITDPKKQEAMVIADDDNFSLAIGKRGQNARLASRLTHYKIDIKTREQASENGINIRTEE